MAATSLENSRCIIVEQMLELNKQVRAAKTQADRELFQRQIDASDAQIDALVAPRELYDLSEEEIRIVGEKT